MLPWTPGFPVGTLKQHILNKYAGNIGYTRFNYDVEMPREYDTMEGLSELAKTVKYMDVGTAVALKTNFLDKGIPIGLTIGYPGHAVAYIVHGDAMYVFDTQKTETEDIYPDLTKQILSALFQKEFQLIDVLEKYPKLNIQSSDDNYCVIWMLFILELTGYLYANKKTVDFDLMIEYIVTVSNKANGSIHFIRQIYEKYSKGISAFSGGKRKMIQKEPKGRCGEPPEGGRRRTKKWIQKVVKNMEKGAFTKQGLRHGETPLEYAKDVLAHPTKHTLKTRRRAQFLKNISKRK